MTIKSKKIIGIMFLLTGLAGLIWYARPGDSPRADTGIALGAGMALAAEESKFDFGDVSMSDGKVRHRFKIRNGSAASERIEKIYTSCMCTEAELIAGGKTFGPYGMPGHGFAPRINAELAPGEEAEVEVEFDPAAHGPAGIGRIERIVYLENSAGLAFQLAIAATVTP